MGRNDSGVANRIAISDDEGLSVVIFGTVGDGLSDDTAALQAALDALPATGGHLYIPQGFYRVTSPLTVTDKLDLLVEFAGGAFIDSHIASGDVLTFDGCQRLTLRNPRFRLRAGSPSAMLVIDGGAWGAIYEPVIWSYIDIPADVDGIVVKNDSYWVEVVRPWIRKESGALTGTLRRGVSFTTISNAGKVLGGSINHCDDGVYINAANGMEVNGTALEGGTNGVHLDGTGTVSNGGARIENLRLETLTNGIKISTTETVFWPPIFIGFLANHMGENNQTNEIVNPNAVPITRMTGSLFQAKSSIGSFSAQVSLQAGDDQTIPLFETLERPSGGGGQTYAIANTGTPYFKSSSAALPTPADDRGIIHNRGFITKIVAWSPSFSGCSVEQVVGNGAGSFTTVTKAFAASFRPGSDNAIDLGLASTVRWRNVYFSGRAFVGGVSTDPVILSGTATPESAVTAPVGSIFMRTDGGVNTSMYVKESGTGNTGWVGK